MPTAPVHVTSALLSGFVQTEFAKTYDKQIAASSSKLGPLMRMGLPSSRSQETHGYFLSAPHPKRWVRGEDIPSQGFDSVTFNVVNRNWAMGVEWHADDVADDQINKVVDRGRDTGQNFALLPERVFFQLLLNSTDLDLLPAVPNAPDGAALYSATDGGGGARFGVTNGNLLTGSGVATGGAIRTDLFNGIEQILSFQDTEGQPYWSPEIVDQGITILYGIANSQVFAEAFVQGRTIQVVSPATGGDVAAAVTNVVLDSGLKVTLWGTPRISDNDWSMFLNGAPTKAIFEQTRQELETNEQLRSNSDIARRTKIEGVFWDKRAGYGISLPLQTLRINN